MKKVSNKTINIIIIIGIIFLLASLFLMLSRYKKNTNHITEITYNEYSELIEKDEYAIILLTTPTCTYCKNYKPSVNSVCDEYNLVAYDLDISTLSYDEYLSIHDKYTVTKDQYNNDIPGILTPTTIITRNGEEIDSVSGDLGHTKLIEFLEKNNIIKK